MPRYYYRRSDGRLTGQAPDQDPRVAHSEYGMTPDVPAPGAPLRCCRWDGTQITIDPSFVAEAKQELRRRIEERHFVSIQKGALNTPFGQFRVRRDDIDAYILIGFAALFALQTSQSFSVTLRRADESSVTLTAQQVLRLLASIGERMAAALGARDAKLNELALATPEQLAMLDTQ